MNNSDCTILASQVNCLGNVNVFNFIFTEYKHNCFNIVIPICQGIPGYTKTQRSLERQRQVSDLLISILRRKSNESDVCYTLRKEITCMNFLMPCTDSGLVKLCRDRCLNFFNTCTTLFPVSREVCLSFPSREGTPIESDVCNVTHWPGAWKWPIPENPVTPTSGKRNAI